MQALTQEEKGLFNFHLSNLEFACGAELNNVSVFVMSKKPLGSCDP